MWVEKLDDGCGVWSVCALKMRTFSIFIWLFIFNRGVTFLAIICGIIKTWLTVCDEAAETANCRQRAANGSCEHTVIEFVFQKTFIVCLFSLSDGEIPSGPATDV